MKSTLTSPSVPGLNRRRFLLQVATTAALCSTASAFAKAKPQSIPFGFSLYNMKPLDVDTALRTCADIGYDCIEWVANADWPSAPDKVSRAERRRLAALLDSLGLSMPTLMQNLSLLNNEAGLSANLDRLKDTAELGHALAPKCNPVIETTLGGKPAQWKDVKNLMVDRLGAWADVAKDAKTVIAIKAHVGGALHTPEDALWLVRQVNNPWIKLTYDFSHFQLRGYKLEDSLRMMIGRTRFIHIKDTSGTAEKFHFLLPGEGNIDYEDYFTLLKEYNYHDPVIVEVSGQIWNKPGYDPVAAAKKCYAKIAPIFDKVGVREMKKAG